MNNILKIGKNETERVKNEKKQTNFEDKAKRKYSGIGDIYVTGF